MEEACELLDMDGIVVAIEQSDIELVIAASHDHVPVLVLLKKCGVLQWSVAEDHVIA